MIWPHQSLICFRTITLNLLSPPRKTLLSPLKPPAPSKTTKTTLKFSQTSLYSKNFLEPSGTRETRETLINPQTFMTLRYRGRI